MFFVNFIVIAAMVAVVVALAFGLSSMARGGSYDLEHAERYMTARVGLQGFAVLLMLLALYLLNA